MNRVYRLVWNPVRRQVQVVSELTAASRSNTNGSRTVCSAFVRTAMPTVSVIAAAVSLAGFSPMASAVTCSATSTAGCSAIGGAGIPARTGSGGAGNGDGGGASTFNASTGTTDPVSGAASSTGIGGAGAATQDGAGGAGGAVGGSGSGTLAVNTSVIGGGGTAGALATNFGTGGGGGGAGFVFSGFNLSLDSGATVQGGAGGAGGQGAAPVASNGGGGGGGGTGLMSTTPGTFITNNGIVAGGAGGAGGGGGATGFGGGGGAGGDGMLVLGTNTSVVNTGSVTGGAGAASGSGSSASPNTFGGGGAGVRLVGAGSSIANIGTINGGDSSGGVAGAGIVTYGNATITNAGTISGGLSGGANASSIQFGGTGNNLNLLSGSTLNGAVTLDAGATATIAAQNPNLSLTPSVVLTDSASTVTFSGTTTGLTVSGAVTGAGNTVATGAGGKITMTAGNTYTGSTTISGGQLALTGSGSIAASSGLLDNGLFDISGTTSGAQIKNLTGSGAVALGSRTLSITSGSGTFSGSIGGSGGVNVSGGTTTLAGGNAYTGATTIGGGTLALSGAGDISASSGVINNGSFDISGTTSGASIATISGTGSVALGGKTLTVNKGSGAFGGSITGTGGLTVSGGALSLTSAMGYTGTTTISGGTLALSGAGDISASSGVVANGTFDVSGAAGNASIRSLFGSGTVALGNNTLTLVNASGNFSGSINGAGTLVLAGGSQVLAAPSNITGSVTIGAGTLALTGGGSIAAANGLIDNGTFDISGTTSGAQIKQLTGTGTVTLGARTLGVTDASGTFAGSINGTGGFLLTSGTQTLTGVNGYTGGTTISAGTLALSGGGVLSSATPITLASSNATLDLSAASAQQFASLSGASGSRVLLGGNALTVGDATDTTFGGTLSGPGAFVKQGTGTLTLDGISRAFSGTTTIAAGTLEVGDAADPSALLGGNVQVASNGTLRGHGTVAGNVANAGLVAPGGTIGTLTLGGDYTQASNGTLSIEVSPTAASQLRVGGTAALNGTLHIVYDPGTYSAGRYSLLTAGNGVSGTFSSITNSALAGADLSSLQQSITYGANQVDLALTAASNPTTGGPGPIVIAPQNTTIFTTEGTSALTRAQTINSALVARLGRNSEAGGSTISPAGTWVSAMGSSTKVSGTGGRPGFLAREYGFLAGIDHREGANTVGIAAGYSHTALDESSTGDSSAADTLRIALYGTRSFGPIDLAATVGYGLDFLSQKRPFGSIGTAEGDHYGNEFSAALQAGMPIAVGGVTMTPRLGLRYAYFRGNGFSESGAQGQNLSVDADNARSLQPFVSLAIDKAFGDALAPIDVEWRVGYAYEALNHARGLAVTSQDGTSFSAPGTDLPRSYLMTGASVSFRPAKSMSVAVGLDALLNVGHASAQSAYARLDYRF
ncbi:autotransporter domain-containing protein [Burkholderia sp. AW49-1]